MRIQLLAAWAALIWAQAALPVQAQTLLDETNTIVAPAAPSAVLREFEVAIAGTYELRVTDLGVPAALINARAAILRDGAIVRELALTAAEASITFDATPGAYSLSIVGAPGDPGVGTIGARLRRGTDTPVVDVAETIEVPNPPPPPTRKQLDTTFRVFDAGVHSVTLSDLGFPAPLAAARLSVVRSGGGALDAQLGAPGVAMFDATPGDYRLFVIADADAAELAGVAHVAVTTAAGTPIYRRMLPAGRVETLGGGLLAAGAHTLVATDLQIPQALSALRVATTSEGALVARLDAPGSVEFTTTGAGHDVLAVAKPTANGSGSYTAELRRAGAPALSFVASVSDGDAAGATTLTGVVATAGSHRLRVTDFAFPQGFTGLRTTVTQGGVSVANLDTPGMLDVNLQAGAVKVLVFGVANTAGNGMYGVELRPVSGSDGTVVEATRGVGSAFDARQFVVTTAGRYRIIADDLEFPQRFAGLDAVITRGPEVVGSFFGGGSFIFNATPGSYFINFIAKPGAQSGGAGTYRMRVAGAPNLPTLTLSANPETVTVGRATQLTWSSTDTTQCVASGAWSGAKTASGNETTAVLSAQTTFTLDCTGPGGTASKQVVVGVSQPPAGGGGGGGAMSETMLLALLAAAVLREWHRSRR